MKKYTPRAIWARICQIGLVKRLREDTVARENTILYGSLLFNLAYATLLLGLGIFHKTLWFSSLSIYYILLALMRFFLLRHLKCYTLCEKMRLERLKCRFCGIVLLLTSLALGVITFFMVYWERGFVHHEITTIALATYTFTSLTLAIIGIVKYRKYNSPVLFASRAVALSSASVAMLTLTSTMLTVFGSGSAQGSFEKIMIGATGVAVISFVVTMAIIMIIKSKKTNEDI